MEFIQVANILTFCIFLFALYALGRMIETTILANKSYNKLRDLALRSHKINLLITLYEESTLANHLRHDGCRSQHVLPDGYWKSIYCQVILNKERRRLKDVLKFGREIEKLINDHGKDKLNTVAQIIAFKNLIESTTFDGLSIENQEVVNKIKIFNHSLSIENLSSYPKDELSTTLWYLTLKIKHINIFR